MSRAKRFSVKFSDRDGEHLERLAKRNGISQNEVLRRSLQLMIMYDESNGCIATYDEDGVITKVKVL